MGASESIETSAKERVENARHHFRIAWNSVTSAIDCAKFRSRSHDAVTRVYDAVGNVIETQEYAGEFKTNLLCCRRAEERTAIRVGGLNVLCPAL